MSSRDGRSAFLFAPLVGVLLSVTSVSSLFVQQSGNAPSAGGVSPAWIRIGVTVLSVVLTGVLAYLYHEQRELNALEHTADVQTEGHRPTDDGDLGLCLSNLGRGAATDLSLRIEASFPDADGYSGLEVEKTPMKRLEQPNDHDVRNEWARPERNYVGPERYFVRFWTPVPVRWKACDDDPDSSDGGADADSDVDSDDETCDDGDGEADGDVNRTVLADLANELPASVDEVRLTVTLDYRDQLDDDKSERIVDDVLPLEPGEDLDFLFSRGMTDGEYERRNESDECVDPFESLDLHRPQLADEFRTGQQNDGEERG